MIGWFGLVETNKRTWRNSIKLISRTEVNWSSTKARNDGDSRSSVTCNGGGEHRSRDRVEAQILGLIKGSEWRIARSGDKHELNKFHAMPVLTPYATLDIRAKRKRYRPTVNHLQSL